MRKNWKGKAQQDGQKRIVVVVVVDEQHLCCCCCCSASCFANLIVPLGGDHSHQLYFCFFFISFRPIFSFALQQHYLPRPHFFLSFQIDGVRERQTGTDKHKHKHTEIERKREFLKLQSVWTQLRTKTVSLWGSRFLIDCCLPLCSDRDTDRERERERRVSK